MRTFWAQPLRRQLLLANLLLFLVPVLGLAIWHSLATLSDHRERLIGDAQSLATSNATYIERDIQYLYTVTELAAKYDVVQALDPVRATEVLAQTLAGRRGLLCLVLTSGGREIARAGDTGGIPSQIWASEPPERRLQLYPAEEGHPAEAIIVSVPVKRDDGTRVGTLTTIVETLRLGDTLKVLALPEGSVTAIVDAGGRVVAQNLPRERDALALIGARSPVSDADTAAVVSGSDGISRFEVASAIPSGPWVLRIAVPRSIASARAFDSVGRSLAVLALGVFGCVLLAWFLAQRLGGSVAHLNAAAKRIAEGDLTPLAPAPMRSAEFVELQASFARMLEGFNATRGALDAQMAEERQIRQELESLQVQLIRTERLAAVGQLVSGVAHEINNPLQAILGFAELLQLQHDVPDSVKSDLRLIQKESARACNIIRNLALFARQQPGEAGALWMKDVIRAVAELRQRRLETEDIELYIEDRAAHPVTAVLTELQQVVLNFIVNAEQAIIASGRLPGRITLRTYDEQERVVMEVEDTGPGIPAEHEAKLFQPFFTTKPVGQGTGLGLSISYGIIDSLGGTIGHRRAPAGGAIFYFALPRRT